jgi:hypothetical protein
MCLPFEPFKKEREWTHAGLLCVATMAREYGNRCGYVRVPPGHPLHGKDIHEDAVRSLSVHGDVTFAGIEPCTHDDGTGWWFGFDCAHAGDAHYDPDSPPNSMFATVAYFERLWHYWTLPEVEVECEGLAGQLAALR